MTSEINLAVAANFVAEPIEQPLRVLLADQQLHGPIRFAPFDQVIQQLLDPASLLRTAEFGVILLQLERWLPAATCEQDQLRRNVNDFIDAVLAATRTGTALFFVITCPVSEARRDDARLRALEERLQEGLVRASGVNLVTFADAHALYPVESYAALFDPFTAREAQIPYSPLCFAILATTIARRLFNLRQRPRKVIVMDCDHTLWAGECGEDGPDNVEIRPGHHTLHEFLIRQGEGGRLVCLCSKNQERSVFDVFARHRDMRLQREHLAAWRINWQPKPENMRALATELSLGLDSFIFIDDDTFECEAMRALCPEVLTLQLPRDDAQIAAFLRDVWELDLRPATAEDRRRTQFYRENAERERERAETSDLAAFIASLDLQVEIEPLTLDDLPRAAQLCERTNQFNLNGIRRSAGELRMLLTARLTECRLIRARDRFGDYGAIGLLIYRSDGETLDVETLLLSCRALGKGVEARIADHILEAADASGVEEITFHYRQTQKNGLVLPFLSQFGVAPTWGRWRRPRRLDRSRGDTVASAQDTAAGRVP